MIRIDPMLASHGCVSTIEEDDHCLQEEMGDLFLVLSMMAYVQEQKGRFQISNVLKSTCAKLIHRHTLCSRMHRIIRAEVIEQWPPS